MKYTINLILMLGLSMQFVNAQIKVDTLTNTKVIKLSKVGLQPSVIIGKIATSYTVFDVSTDSLIKLNEEGVSADVINAMINANQQSKITFINQKDENDPLTKRAAGIYLFISQDTFQSLKNIDPTVISTNTSGGVGYAIASYYTGGLAKSNQKSALSGSKSHLQISESSPLFYFYFDNNSNASSWFFSAASSPNEFVLVKLDEKKDSREMIVGNMNAYGSSTGIPNKIKVQFEYEIVAEGIYRVSFKQPLEKGEYCFVYASTTPSSYNNNKVFDFGIQNEF